MATILLVDDNPLRASLRQALLERNTYGVVRVADAADALRLVESPELAPNLQLVVTGHGMPGISGPEFVAELRSRMPHVPILVLGAPTMAEAGYAGIAQVYHAQANSTDELRQVVGKLLAGAQKQMA